MSLPLAAGLLSTMAGCALKKPPDAAAVKEQALPALRTPAEWTVKGAGSGAVSDNWVATFHDEQLAAAVAEAIAHDTDLRVGAARVAAQPGRDLDEDPVVAVSTV
jgi:outer membrane protein, multidrug efflux system